MTNFEKVRNMPVHEFIRLFEFKDCIMCIDGETIKCPYFGDSNECKCENGLMEWLYREVGENAGTDTTEKKP